MGYFWGLLSRRFLTIRNVERSIEMDIKDIKCIKGTKVGGKSERKYIDETS